MKEKKFVDIHCHSLFGVDDGAASLEETMGLLEMADKEEIGTIILTPHYSSYEKADNKARIMSNYGLIREYCADCFPDLKLYLGNEILYGRSVVDDLERGNAFTLAETRYVLIEFDIAASFEYIYEAVRTLTSSGFWPVIAHTERYDDLFQKKGQLGELIETGAYVQVNSNSFLGGRLDRMKRRTFKMLKAEEVHFIADDSHNLRTRKPLMKQIYEELSVKFERQQIDRIFYENPEKLLADDFV